MIEKEKFYNQQDYPDSGTKNRIWKNIEKNIKTERQKFFIIGDMPSFYYGMAATIILFFVFYGVFSFGRNFIYQSKPEEIKLNSAYQSAIKEFENVMPAVASTEISFNNEKSYLNIKMEQLRQIDNAIKELRGEMKNNDLTPLKQLSLRQLYISKMKILIDIIEQGEIKL